MEEPSPLPRIAGWWPVSDLQFYLMALSRWIAHPISHAVKIVVIQRELCHHSPITTVVTTPFIKYAKNAMIDCISYPPCVSIIVGKQLFFGYLKSHSFSGFLSLFLSQFLFHSYSSAELSLSRGHGNFLPSQEKRDNSSV